MRQLVDDAATLAFAALLGLLLCIGIAGLMILSAAPQPPEARA